MTIDDKCVAVGADGCGKCDGYNEKCIDYIPEVYEEMYEATAVDKVIEFCEQVKNTVKNYYYKLKK